MMSLKNKLSTLKNQVQLGAAPDLRTARDLCNEASPTDSPRKNSTRDLIAQIRRTQGSRVQRAGVDNPRESFSEKDLANHLGAQVIADGVLLKTKELALNKILGLEEQSDFYIENRKINFLGETVHTGQLVFMDTETTGLSGGAGTMVFLLGLAKIDFSRKVLIVRQYFLSRFAGEKAMLSHAKDFLETDDVLVTYNGKSFDTPLLANRYRLSNSDCPFTPLRHIDLLHPTRRAFQKKWRDCRLNTAEKKLLGFFRKDDLPGSEAPWVWTEWVRFGIHQRVKDVMKHNYFDLVSLAGLLPKIRSVYQQPHSHNADLLSVARWYESKARYAEAQQLLEDNRQVLDDDGLRTLAWCYRRQQQWSPALGIWVFLSKKGCRESIENIAKYYEHRQKDYESALSMTEMLPDKNKNDSAYCKRKERLQRKMTKCCSLYS